jgi:hypothetical protein
MVVMRQINDRMEEQKGLSFQQIETIGERRTNNFNRLPEATNIQMFESENVIK